MQQEFETFYNERLHEFGNSAQGVGWKNEEAQIVRFDQLLKVVKAKGKYSINDLGCGLGEFANYLLHREHTAAYHGYDILPEMVARAKERYRNKADIAFSIIRTPQEMQVADYTIASGIFNIRFAQDDERWLQYILETITAMNEKSTAGFAFNCLTKYSDADHMKDDLYYSDPLFLFDYCKKNFARNVALLHDYNQYDFTIIVRK